MLLLERLYLVQLNCANTCLFREQLAKLVEGDDFLILCKVFLLVHLLLSDFLIFLEGARTKLWDHISDSLVEDRALEPGIGGAEGLEMPRFELGLESRGDRVRARARPWLCLHSVVSEALLWVYGDRLLRLSLLLEHHLIDLGGHCTVLYGLLEDLLFLFALSK